MYIMESDFATIGEIKTNESNWPDDGRRTEALGADPP
jgi:hypothetical protein